MAKRHSKTAAQQCRYYEVDNIFEYMVETYINGNFSTFREVVPRAEQGSEKGLHRFSFSGMFTTIPHRDFTRNCLTH